MSFLKIVLNVWILFFVLSGCGGSGSETLSRELPKLKWINPVSGATVFPQISTSFLIDVVDAGSSRISKVSFYVDGEWIYDDFVTPFGVSYSFPDPGPYTLKAIAWGNQGAVSEALIDVVVGETISVPHDSLTIQGAIQLAGSGDLILISPGLYRENIFIMDKNIAVTSFFYENEDDNIIDQTVVDGGGGTVFSIFNSPGVKILGLTIQNGDDGISTDSMIFIENNNITLNNDGIDYESGGGFCSKNMIHDNRDDAIDLDGSVQVDIYGNILSENDDDGIEIRLHEYSGSVLMINIVENMIYLNGEDGIQLIDHEGPSSREFLIERNIIFDNSYSGIGMMNNGNTLEDFSGAQIQDPIRVINNTFSGNSYGITGGSNLIAVNNLFLSSQNTGVENVRGESLLSYNLFWQNYVDYSESNVDEGLTIISDPLIDGNFTLADDSPAIDAGAAQFSNNGVIVLDLSASQYLGVMPDLGAIEKR